MAKPQPKARNKCVLIVGLGDSGACSPFLARAGCHLKTQMAIGRQHFSVRDEDCYSEDETRMYAWRFESKSKRRHSELFLYIYFC